MTATDPTLWCESLYVNEGIEEETDVNVSGPWAASAFALTGRFKFNTIYDFFATIYVRDALGSGPKMSLGSYQGAGSFGTLGGGASIAWQANTWYQFKWVVTSWTGSSGSGDSYLKVWLSGQSEPGAWQATGFGHSSGELSQRIFGFLWRVDSSTTNTLTVDDLAFGPAPILPKLAAPAGTESNPPLINQVETGDPTNTFNGTYSDSHVDVAIAGRGPAIQFARSYNSNDPRATSLGPGWTHSYNIRLTDPNDGTKDVILVGPQGRSDRYVESAGTFAPPVGVHRLLVKNADESYTATDKAQTIWQFDANGKLTQIVDRYGNASNITYNSSGQVAYIGDPAGRGFLTLAYTNNLLASVTDWATPARSVTYQYDGSGRLWKATDREGKTTTYTYDGTSQRVATVTNARSKVVLTTTYDAQGRVATQKDARGLGTGDATTFSYVTNPDGTRVTTTTAPVTSFEPSFHPAVTDSYDNSGWLVSRVVQPTSTDSQTWAYTYDINGNQLSRTDPRGNRTDFCYDVSFAGAPIAGGAANLTRRIDPPPQAGANRPVLLLRYDSKNNLVQVVSPRGVSSGPTATCSSDYSAINSMYSIDSVFDSTGAALLSTTTRSTDPDSGPKTSITKYEYADATNPGRITRVIPPRGNTSGAPDYTYAATMTYFTSGASRGMLKDITDALGNRTSFGYDALGRTTSSVDALGSAIGGVAADHTTTYEYDKEDRIRFTRLPAPAPGGAQLVTEHRYDEVGNQIAQIDANGQVTTYTYDDRSSLYQVKESPLPWTDPLTPPSLVITMEYTRDAGGNPTRITRAKGDAANERVLDYTYDGHGLPRSETQYPAWPATTGLLVTTYGYDPDGNATTTSDPLGRTLTIGFDALNRRTSLDYSDPSTHDVVFGYDASGNRISMVDGAGTTTYTYDEVNQPTSTSTPGPKTIGYRYDLDGNRTKLIYSDSTSVSSAFDKAGQLTSLSDWASRQVSYQYWPDGLVKQLVNPNASTTTYSYDNARRSVELRHQRAAGQQIDRFYYSLDGLGNVLSVTNGSLAPQFARPDGLASSSGTWVGTFASINEPAANDATFIASPTSPTTSHYYEVTLSDVDLPAATTGITFRYRYAKSGNDSGKIINLTVELRQGSTVIASLTHNNIPGASGSGWQTGSVTLTPAQAALITNYSDLRLRFRPSSSGGGQGREAQVSWAETQTPGPGTPSTLVSYGYDKLSRLTSSNDTTGSRSYVYDSVGNRLTRVDGATTTYTYDRADRLTSAGALSVSVDADGNLTAKGPDLFAFDQANRLTAATVSGTTESYAYDGDGTRVSRKVGAGTPTKYVLDPFLGLPITLEDGSRKYVYGLGLVYDVLGSSIEVYHSDRLGSVRSITDASGATIATYRTDDWGRKVTGSGSTTQPFDYTGEPRDQSGLTYLRSRYFDSDLGRFLTRDQWLGIPTRAASQNRYSYAENDPTTYGDLSGRFIDTALDVGFIIYDAHELLFGSPKEGTTNFLALGADVVCLFVPFLTGAGLAVRSAERASDIEKLFTKLTNLAHHINAETLDAVTRELAGEVVKLRDIGVPYNHVQEMTDTANGLRNLITRATSQLAEQGLSEAERGQLNYVISEASKLLDWVDKYLP